MKKAIQEINKKLSYYEKQLETSIDRFIRENTRISRDSVIRTKEKINTYKECLKLIENDK